MSILVLIVIVAIMAVGIAAGIAIPLVVSSRKRKRNLQAYNSYYQNSPHYNAYQNYEQPDTVKLQGSVERGDGSDVPRK